MNRMKELREERGLTMKETAAQLGMPYTTYVNYEKSLREPNSETLIKIASFFHVSVDYLLGYVSEPEFYLDNQRIVQEINKYGSSDPSPSKIRPDYSHIKNVMPVPETKQLPVIGTIACGTPILAEQNIEDMVNVPSFVHADFVLRCSGDSMIGAHIRDGDLVCIRIQPDVDDGQIAAVLIGEEATLKRVYHRPNGVTLMAENPAFPPMVYIGEECEDIRIMGKAITCVSKVR